MTMNREERQLATEDLYGAKLAMYDDPSAREGTSPGFDDEDYEGESGGVWSSPGFVDSLTGDDLTGLFFDEVGQTGLLTRADEVSLARRMEEGVRAEKTLATGQIPATIRQRCARRSKTARPHAIFWCAPTFDW